MTQHIRRSEQYIIGNIILNVSLWLRRKETNISAALLHLRNYPDEWKMTDDAVRQQNLIILVSIYMKPNESLDFFFTFTHEDLGKCVNSL